jgi:hypothetical protein
VNGDIRLVQLELRQPRFPQSLAEELFKFDPGSAKVIDVTDECVRELQRRVEK